ERRAEAIEARLPQLAVAGQPGVDLAERLGAQRVEPALAGRAHADEAGREQDAQVARDARLEDAEAADQVVHRPLAAAQDLDDPAAGRVGEGLEDVQLHQCAYAYQFIYISSSGTRAGLAAPRSRAGGRAAAEGGPELIAEAAQVAQAAELLAAAGELVGQAGGVAHEARAAGPARGDVRGEDLGAVGEGVGAPEGVERGRHRGGRARQGGGAERGAARGGEGGGGRGGVAVAQEQVEPAALRHGGGGRR